jgi:predicted nucleic acid-binding protein
VKTIEPGLQGYKQLTDAYLLALAHRRKGVLASFDRGLRTLAGDTFADAVEIVATR